MGVYPRAGGLRGGSHAGRMAGMSAIDVALRAMGVQDWSLSRGSLESDELRLSFYVPTGGARPALSVGDEFEAGGWCGWVWDVQDGQRASGGRTVNVTVKGVIAFLDSIPCPLIDRDGETELVRAATVLGKAQEAAVAAGAGLSWSGIDGTVLTVPAGSSSSVWGVVQSVLRWLPDVRSRQVGRCLVLEGGAASVPGSVATASVVLSPAARGVLRVAGSVVDLAELHEAEAGRFNWAASVHELVARQLAGNGLVLASSNGRRLELQARAVGEAGNALELAYVPAVGEDGSVVSLRVFSGGAVDGAVDGGQGDAPVVLEGVGWQRRTEYSEGLSMDDLLPPVVACRGGVCFEIPAGASIYQPGAFVYPVPFKSLADRDVEETRQTRDVQRKAGQWVHVKGLKVPEGWVVPDGEPVRMRQPGGNVQAWHGFWRQLEAFALLQKVSAGCLSFGTAVFEPVPAEVAYPVPEDGFADVPVAGAVLPERSMVPANYEVFTGEDAEHFYVLREGSFPASSDRRGNVRGLKFCRGVLRQYVWLSSVYEGSASVEEAKAFFSGEHVVDGRTRHYALLSLEAVFINRQRTRYQTGTNRLAPDDPEYSPDEDADLPTAEPTPDYYGAMERYWSSCQRARLGGRSVTVYGVTGVDPASVSLSAVQALLGVEADACRMQWDAGARTLTLQTGRREILGVDELLSRQMMGRRSAEDRATNEDLGAGRNTEFWPELDQDEEPEGDGFPMVGPSINAGLVAAKDAKACEPFTLFQDDDRAWWISGGVLPAGAGFIRVEPKLVTVEVKDGRTFAVKARWDEASQSYKPKYIYYDEQ